MAVGVTVCVLRECYLSVVHLQGERACVHLFVHVCVLCMCVCCVLHVCMCSTQCLTVFDLHNISEVLKPVV